MGSWRYYLLSDDAYIATSVPPRITYDKIRCMTVSYWGLVPFHTQSQYFSPNVFSLLQGSKLLIYVYHRRMPFDIRLKSDCI